MTWSVNDLSLNADKIVFIADLNGDKYVDILIRDSNNKLQAIYQKEQTSNTVNFESIDTKIDLTDIDKLYATSINSDEHVDIVTVGKSKLTFYEGSSENNYSSTYSIDRSSDSNVLLWDLNFDGIIDVIEISAGKTTIYLSNPIEKNLNYKILKLEISISAQNVFVFDVNGDCISDLFLIDSTGKYEVYSFNYQNDLGSSKELLISSILKKIDSGSITNFNSLIGVGDFDRNGSMDILYNDGSSLKLLKNTLIETTSCEGTFDGNYFKSSDIAITGDNTELANLKSNENICIGDYNLDSFLDIVYLSGSKIYILENQGTSLSFKNINVELETPKSISQLSCFDYKHNGFFNLITIAEGSISVLENKKQVQNYFLKLSGLVDCDNCPDKLPPSTRLNWKFYLSDEYGNKHSISLGHSNVQVGLNYNWIGLGSNTNYISQLYIGTHEIIPVEGITPNSHLFYFSSQILLYMKMNDAFIVIAVLIASSIIGLATIWWLHNREKREDLRIRMASTNRVLLRGL
eukprot:NODE_4_length_77007_cov_1.156642.p13 type:complete len:519 gc:universal NODE_4_length_77007_cov_1.156642:55887-54331(-)